MTNLLGLLVFTFMLAIGQLLFKKTAVAMVGQPLRDGLLAVLCQPLFYAALTLYGFATLLWIWLLSRVPLSQAYPFVAGGVIIVPLLSVLLLGERVTFVFWLGAACVAIGVLLTQYGVAVR